MEMQPSSSSNTQMFSLPEKKPVLFFVLHHQKG
jgi:hypothetical protein